MSSKIQQLWWKGSANNLQNSGVNSQRASETPAGDSSNSVDLVRLLLQSELQQPMLIDLQRRSKAAAATSLAASSCNRVDGRSSSPASRTAAVLSRVFSGNHHSSGNAGASSPALGDVEQQRQIIAEVCGGFWLNSPIPVLL
ncbi:hypothetical protein C2S52_004130 [Perilla frutescens var. hirtella]|nr:hypothetical protein C2S52_004130 [Perilla frutescens var. hirtella]